LKGSSQRSCTLIRSLPSPASLLDSRPSMSRAQWKTAFSDFHYGAVRDPFTSSNHASISIGERTCLPRPNRRPEGGQIITPQIRCRPSRRLQQAIPLGFGAPYEVVSGLSGDKDDSPAYRVNSQAELCRSHQGSRPRRRRLGGCWIPPCAGSIFCLDHPWPTKSR